MTSYPYGMKGAPVVGNGLGGLPRRSVDSGTTVVTPTSEAPFGIIGSDSPYLYSLKTVNIGLPPLEIISGLSSRADATAISKYGKYIACGLIASPYLAVYKNSGGVFTKLSDADVLPSGIVLKIAFYSENAFVCTTNTGILAAYKIVNDAVVKIVEVGGLTNVRVGQALAVSGDGSYVAVLTSSAPYLKVFKQSNNSFTYLAGAVNTDTLTPVSQSLAFTKDGNYLAAGGFASPYFHIYKRTDDTFTKLTNPAILPSSTITHLRFSPDGSSLLTCSNTEGVYPYSRSGDTFTRGATLGATGVVQEIAFTSDSKYAAIINDSTPYIQAYTYSGSAYAAIATTSVSTPALAVASYAIAFHPSGLIN